VRPSSEFIFNIGTDIELLSGISSAIISCSREEIRKKITCSLELLGKSSKSDCACFLVLSARHTAVVESFEWRRESQPSSFLSFVPSPKKLLKALPKQKSSGTGAYLSRDSSDDSSVASELLCHTGLSTIFIQPIYHPSSSIGLLIVGSRNKKRKPNRNESAYLSTLGNILFAAISSIPKEAGNEIWENHHVLLKEVFDNLPDFLYVKDLDSRFVLANAAQVKLLGKKQITDLLGKTDFDIYPRDLAERYYADERRVLSTGKPLLDREEPGLDQSGNPICVSTTKIALHDEKGRIVGLLGIGRDITERRKLLTEILKARKIESMSVVAGGISNELNNLLTAILGSISLAKCYLPPEDPAFKRITQAQEACINVKELSDRLSKLSKGAEPVKKITRLDHLLREEVFFSLSVSPAAILCDFQVGNDLFPVEIDEDQIKQVINHLVMNAIEAMPTGGRLRVSAENINEEKREDPFDKHCSGNYVRITIEDKGPGIPLEYFPKIFDPYFTTKEKREKRGRGLGLPVCHSIIKKHGGIINLESEPGIGTKARIYLPSVGLHNIRDLPAGKTAGIRKNRILVMDDEAFVRTVAGEMLTHMGFEVEYARDGLEAVESYRKALNSGNRFTAVILDLFVTGGSGGEEAIQALLDLDSEVKGIVATGYGEDPVARQYKKYGFVDIINKPFNLEQLEEVIRRVLA